MRDHRLYAAVYDRMTAPAEAAGLAERRRRLLAGATGRVLEVGGGTGHNLAHYTAATEVVVLEPDGAMRRHLENRLHTCPVPVRVVAAGIEDPGLGDLGVADGAFDTVVCTLVLCTVPDEDAAAGRIARLLAPDGRVLFLEHVLGPGARGLVQRMVTPLWRVMVPGCHLDRDPVPALRRAGLLPSDYERVHLPLGPLASPGVVGTAVRSRSKPLVEPGSYPL
ncbi:MAG TPA: class I SAM-dependent methyltransferase [Acidimicrobiales bacterium]|nr:class I SAM-dependent methyltransferase [Acidimicrobiales bacterium]